MVVSFVPCRASPATGAARCRLALTEAAMPLPRVVDARRVSSSGAVALGLILCSPYVSAMPAPVSGTYAGPVIASYVAG